MTNISKALIIVGFVALICANAFLLCEVNMLKDQVDLLTQGLEVTAQNIEIQNAINELFEMRVASLETSRDTALSFFESIFEHLDTLYGLH